MRQPKYVKLLVVFAAFIVCMGTSRALQQPPKYSPKGFPMIQFSTQQEASAFDFGIEVAVKGIIRACQKKGYYGNGNIWFDCKPRPVKKL